MKNKQEKKVEKIFYWESSIPEKYIIQIDYNFGKAQIFSGSLGKIKELEKKHNIKAEKIA